MGEASEATIASEELDEIGDDGADDAYDNEHDEDDDDVASSLHEHDASDDDDDDDEDGPGECYSVVASHLEDLGNVPRPNSTKLTALILACTEVTAMSRRSKTSISTA